MKINPLRVLFLVLWFTVGYTLIPFDIIERTGNFIYALICNVILSIIIAIILEIKIREPEDDVKK